jgi:hypothetical protein
MRFSTGMLPCGTVYHYRVIAFGTHGTTATPDDSFTTAECQPGTIKFKKSNITIKNTQAVLSLSVERAGGSDGPITVAYATADGGAKAGTDYNSASGTLRWDDGDLMSKQITLFSLMNPGRTKDVDFTVSLSEATGGAEAGKASTITLTPQGTGGSNPPPSHKPPPSNPPPSKKPPSKSGGGGGALGPGSLLLLAALLVFVRWDKKE